MYGLAKSCKAYMKKRNKAQSTIRGTLYSEEELGRICKEHGLSYETVPSENGALLYFLVPPFTRHMRAYLPKLLLL
jgi:hypothetical protein